MDDELCRQLIAHKGNVQDLDLPSGIKVLSRNVWEIKQCIVFGMVAGRGAYIDQSQSWTIHMIGAITGKVFSMYFHGWQLGLKTGMY